MNDRNKKTELGIVSALMHGGKNTVEAGFRDILPTSRICIDDILEDWQAERLADLANTLRQLKGRKVLDVIWENIPDKIENPNWTAGRFVFVLERDNEKCPGCGLYHDPKKTRCTQPPGTEEV